MRFSLILTAVLVLVSTVLCGDPGSGPITGHLRTDLFGSGVSLTPARGRLSILPQESAPAAAGEKSPWIAGLLSFALPGSGEMYAGSYLKGGIFLAAEASMWALAYSYDKQGDDLTEKYEAYANAHWSATRYIQWTLTHLGTLNPLLTTTADEYSNMIYPEDDPPCDPPFSCVDWSALNAMEREIALGALNGYTHALPPYGAQQYYELIGKYEQYSRGWDDSGDLNPELENNVPIRSTSNRFFEYAKMRARANDKYDVAGTFVKIAVVNHVLSAIDAFWTVSRINKALRAEVRMNMQQTPAGPVPATTARFQFTF